MPSERKIVFKKKFYT
jgi:hypothetical protein